MVNLLKQGKNISSRIVQLVCCVLFFNLVAVWEVKAAPASSLGGKENPFVTPALCEIEKPVDYLKIKRARVQPEVPTTEKWQENPFVESAPKPVFNKDESRRGYLLFRRPITSIVYPNSRPKHYERLEKLTGFGCHNEFEPLTFSVYPTRELKNLRVRVSGFYKGPDVIPSSAISVQLQTYWQIPYPHYVTSGDFFWRRMPELLEPVTVHTSAAEVCQRYWLTIKVPKDAVPGVYHGQVTLWDDGYSKAVQIPISFRVMSFELQKDPNKHYTAYYYDYLWDYDDSNRKKENNEWILKAAENSYRSMVEHGFDAMPTIYIRYDSKKDRLYIRQMDRIMALARKAGFKNIPFVPTCAGNAIELIIRKYDKKFKRPSHWEVGTDKMPAKQVYTKITELFKKLNAEWQANGYPKMYCCPLDEVSSSSWKFGAKVYAAVKRSGVGVYITKNPLAVDAHHYQDGTDAFCSQPYALPYEQITASKRLQYWCYPNHNAWEVRKPSVMCNGGRMTYGFGFWRSGYTVLIPWSWGCWRYKTDISYTSEFRMRNGKKTCYTPAGNPVDENGNVLNAIYWECFREGYDDGRYIYTLQQAIRIHAASASPECEAFVKEGKSLLQKIWDRIQVEQKYKSPDTVSILPEEFDALRWQMAALTEELSKFNGKSQSTVSGPVVKIAPQVKSESILAQESMREKMLIKSLGDEEFSCWKNVTKEGHLSIVDTKAFTGQKCLKYHIIIDHNTDGEGKKGTYPVGWPRIVATFKAGELDLSQYEYLSFHVMIDSDRDEVSDDNTPAFWTFSSYAKGDRLPSQSLLGQVPQRVWLPVMIPLNSIIGTSTEQTAWQSIQRMQFGINERDYNNGTGLTFYLDDISLIRFKVPVIENVLVSSSIVLPQKSLFCKLSILGTSFVKRGEYRVIMELLDGSGNSRVRAQEELKDCYAVVLDLPSLNSGIYTLRGSILNAAGQMVSHWETPLTAVIGPAAE
ncbi:MAG: hypothetical protein WCS73_05830 [Lentisphaeria bacterium]